MGKCRTKYLTLILAVLIVGSEAQSQCPSEMSFEGASVNDRFGRKVVGGWDFDQDGFDDILVSAPLSGTVYVFSGLDGDTIHVFSGSAEDQFGQGVSGVEDIDGDSYPDIAIGAPNFNVYNNEYNGRVYLYSGQTGSLIYELPQAYPSYLFGQTGFDISAAGDIDGDERGDFIVGCPSLGVGSYAGRAYVYSGLTGDTLFRFNGEYIDALFGYAVSATGDVNNDGVNDFAIGQPGSITTANDIGRMFVFSGATGDTLYTFIGEEDEDRFGSAVAIIGDVNGDGFDEILVGAFGHDLPYSACGKIYLFSGFDGSLIYQKAGAQKGAQLGTSVSRAGDVNSDGHDDFIAGAPGNYTAGPTGRVFLYSGLFGEVINYFLRDSTGDDLFGSSVSAGDSDNDGANEILIGCETKTGSHGQVQVFEYYSDCDEDGIPNAYDNCLLVPNLPQEDSDADGIGDACDNCISVLNPDQVDTDLDGLGDACDDCTDSDGDGYGDPGFVENSCATDNCWMIYNPDQLDSDGNGWGDACQTCCNLGGDMNHDGWTDISDLVYYVDYLFQGGTPPPCLVEADVDEDCILTISDLTRFIDFMFSGGPGPQCHDCSIARGGNL